MMRVNKSNKLKVEAKYFKKGYFDDIVIVRPDACGYQSNSADKTNSRKDKIVLFQTQYGPVTHE